MLMELFVYKYDRGQAGIQSFMVRVLSSSHTVTAELWCDFGKVLYLSLILFSHDYN